MRARTFSWLCFAMLLVSSVAAARPRSVGGRVTFVAAGRAYLDRGRAAGLGIGDELELRRGRGKSASCKVVELADHFAACAGADVGVGDTFAAPRPPPRARGESTRKRPKPASAEELSAWQARLARASFEKVDYRGDSVAATRVRGAIELGHAVWTRVEASRGTFQEERLAIDVVAADLGTPGLLLSARMTASYWSQRPDSARFRPDADAQLYVSEASLAYRRRGGPVGAAGRLRPWFVPGLAVLDGVQLGWRSERAQLEVGAFAGGLPEPVTLEPSVERWTAGVYATGDVALGDDVLLRPSARAALLQVEDGRWVSAELDARTRIGRGVGLGARARADAPVDSPGRARLSAIAIDLDTRPHERLTLFASARRFDAWQELAELRPSLREVERGDVGAQLDVTDWLALVGVGGVTGGDGAPRRGFVNPELRVWQVLPWRATLALGYMEELGYLGAHTVYVQGLGAPTEAVRLWTRLSYVHGAGDIAEWDEAGLNLGADAALAAWLRLRLSAFGQYGRFGGDAGEAPIGLAARLSLVGEL